MSVYHRVNLDRHAKCERQARKRKSLVDYVIFKGNKYAPSHLMSVNMSNLPVFIGFDSKSLLALQPFQLL